MKLNRRITLSKELQKKVSTLQMIIAITALILFGSRYCFSQSHNTGQTMNANIKQEERITNLEKRIAEAGDDFVSLTMEEYELLLSQPVGTVDGFEPLTTTAGGIMVGIGFSEGLKIHKTDIQTIFPNLPNIGEGEVFVLFNFVKGTNGLDYLDRVSNTENEEKEFTQLTLDIQTAGSKSYLFGSRYVNLRDPEDSITVRTLGALGGEVELSAVSGKIIMQLPTNITGITLTKEDIGLEKPFAGGVITLKEINDDNLSFKFSNSNKNIYAWTVFDDMNVLLDIHEVLLNDGLYQLSVDHAKTVNLYQADIIRKEFPFAFEIERQAATQQIPEVEDTKTGEAQTNKEVLVYLDKNDPKFISIKRRAFSDLDTIVKAFDPESEKNKLIDIQTKTWTEEMRGECQAIGVKSINDYAEQTHFDAGMFMMIITTIGGYDQKKLEKEWEVRVQSAGADKYVAEFWEDGLVVNSEENAVAYAHELANSEYAKKHPDSDVGNVEVIKKNYADNRKTIKAGKQERYQKMIALLYSVDKGGAVTLINPFQPAIDFLNKNSK
ncbi:MAG: hypothetical protein M0P61_09865 [Ignavibacteriaceae bacterium]|nr:hypothetical protein [Ignavibacteriaceae bacterium]